MTRCELEQRRDAILELVRAAVPTWDASSAGLIALEAYYSDHVRRRAFRTTPFHSMKNFEAAMGIAFAEALVCAGCAVWKLDSDTLGVAQRFGPNVVEDVATLFVRRPVTPMQKVEMSLAESLNCKWPPETATPNLKTMIAARSKPRRKRKSAPRLSRDRVK